MIAYVTANRTMPPWKPDPAYKHFADERVLSTDEINRISEWVNNDMPEGNPADLPEPPVFPTGSHIGIPDFQEAIPTYTVSGTSDVYRNFVLSSTRSVDQWVKAVEVVPGNRQIVHHVLVFADTTGAARSLDAQSPTEPGYPSSGGGVGVSGAVLLCGWVPGGGPLVLPDGLGLYLSRKADLILQVHYAPGSQNQLDATQLLLKYYPPTQQAIRRVQISAAINHGPALLNGPLRIEPNEIKTFDARFTLPRKTTVLGVAPHMHLIGRSFKVWGEAAGEPEIPLISVPDWDFNWQGFYMYKNPVILSTGTQVKAQAVYNNTANNPFQPANPPVRITVGEGTTDEMLLCYFISVPYRTGDELLEFDSTPTHQANPLSQTESPVRVYKPYPSPTDGLNRLDLELKHPSVVELWVLDQQGRRVKRVIQQQELPSGKHGVEADLTDLANGRYVYEIVVNGQRLTQGYSILKS
jgi:hypothetical protein